MNQADKN